MPFIRLQPSYWPRSKPPLIPRTRLSTAIGSKDRRTLTNLVWDYIRHLNRLNYCFPDLSIADRIKKLASPDPSLWADAPDFVRWEVPAWLIPLIPNAAQELPALLEAAPTIVRANGDREAIRAALQAEGIDTVPTTHSPYGLRLTGRTNLQATQTFRSGLIEVQDEGSQCVALATGIKAGNTVLDYCAGAGGKSLIFAQMMGKRVHITAHDISDISLRELAKRAHRAHATCIRIEKPLKPAHYDHVVVDAPCSGTGTWRRCPDRRHKLTQEQFSALLRTQSALLDKATSYTRLTGFLSYMTCSLTSPENTEQARQFLTRHPDFCLTHEEQFSPARTQTDGLYVAIFQKIK